MSCDWGFEYSACSDVERGLIDGLDEATRASAEEMARAILDAWTGGVFGVCTVKIRPCRVEERGARGRGVWLPVDIGGTLYPVNGGCGCRAACDCSSVSFIDLPAPVQEVVSVKVDGKELDGSKWRLEEHRYLVALEGYRFPACQDMGLPASMPNTFEVELRRGVPLPHAGKIASGLLAAEFAKALCNDSSCKLPQRVQTITRQGVTMTLQDSYEDLERGRTGIWAVDSWVTAVTSPKNARMTVFTPETMPKPGVRGRRYV